METKTTIINKKLFTIQLEKNTESYGDYLVLYTGRNHMDDPSGCYMMVLPQYPWSIDHE